MATWHFHCQAIPFDSWQRVANGDGAYVLLEPERCWRGAALEGLDAALDTLGVPSPTWDPIAVRWGDEDGTHVSCAREAGGVIELQLHLDLRTSWPSLVPAFLSISRQHSLLLVSEAGAPVAATLEALDEAARRSPAFQFVTNPLAYLRGKAPDRR